MKKRSITAKQSNSVNSTVLLLLGLAIAVTFVISLIALINTIEIKKSLPQSISAQDFLEKLTNHDEAKQLIGVSPLNIIEITQSNIQSLSSQITGLDQSYVGNFIVQYPDVIIIYDYNNDQIRGNLNLQQQNDQLPNDFFQKLNKHQELQGLENEQPVGGQLDQQTLSTLQQQFPQVYSQAKVGDFLLRYQSKLIIYDYNKNKIVTSVSLQ